MISTANDLNNTIAMDLLGRFPITSAMGNKYVFIMYDCNSNYIKPVAMKSQETDKMIRCYGKCYEYYKKSGFTAKLLELDNKVSKTLVKQIKDDELEYQLVSPGDHWLNPCKRAIQDFKCHFISMLAGTDPEFLKNRWDLLLEQAEITLNISWASNINPRVSAYTLINGTYNFNKNPLSPAGCKAIIHDRPDEQASWAEHGLRGFCIGPALNHWQCYLIYVVETKGIQVSNTVEFFLQKCSDPMINEEKQIGLLLDNLVSILSKPTRMIPSITYGSELNNALHTMQ